MISVTLVSLGVDLKVILMITKLDLMITNPNSIWMIDSDDYKPQIDMSENNSMRKPMTRITHLIIMIICSYVC